MEEYTGRYALTPAIIYEIRTSGGVFEGQRTEGKPEHYRPKYRTCYLLAENLATGKFFCVGPMAGSRVLPKGARPGISSGSDCPSAAEACANMLLIQCQSIGSRFGSACV
jgi:hypothetical protein